MTFDYDEVKAALNPIKHDGVTFGEGKTVFLDPSSTIFDDEDHSDDEGRELVIGYSHKNRILIVSFVERTPDGSPEPVIRIISARKATPSERREHGYHT